MGQILLAGVKPHERSPLIRGVVTHRSGQRWVARLEGVQDLALGDRRVDLEVHLSAGAGQCAKVRRQDYADHARV